MGTLNRSVNAVKKMLGIKEKVNLKEINSNPKGAGKINNSGGSVSLRQKMTGAGTAETTSAYKQAYRSNKRYL